MLPAAAVNDAKQPFTVTKFIVGELYLYDDKRLTWLINNLRTYGVNTVTVPIVWGQAEPTPDAKTLDFSLYYPGLDRLAGAWALSRLSPGRKSA